MSNFQVLTYSAKIKEHPNADLIEIVNIGDYQSIVRKGELSEGQTVAYIPEASIVPENILEELGLVGKLSGKLQNRVKAVKLRGVLSQGIVYPMERPLGTDVTEELGITKYVPPIPVHMKGQVQNLFGKTIKYDIENIKLYPDILQEGEQVFATEKLHGTWACCGLYDEETPVVNSKGVSAGGLGFKLNEENAKNLYIKNWENNKEALYELYAQFQEPVYVIGEIFGRKVQDLQYGQKTQIFRAFDMYLGEPEKGRYLEYDEMVYHLEDRIETVPLVYRGAYSKEKILEVTSGQSLIGGNIREGIVIKPIPERRDDEIGRVILKSVSEKYLLRRNATEFE